MPPDRQQTHTNEYRSRKVGRGGFRRTSHKEVDGSRKRKGPTGGATKNQAASSRTSSSSFGVSNRQGELRRGIGMMPT
jgi:hypothetical protein